MSLLILDKDGTLVKPVSGGQFVQSPKDQELLPGVAEALTRYQADGWKIAIASNQGGVWAGHKSLEDAVAEIKFCVELLQVKVEIALICPDNGETCVNCIGDEFDDFFVEIASGDTMEKLYGAYQIAEGEWPGDNFNASGRNEYILENFGGFRKPSPGMLLLIQDELGIGWPDDEHDEKILYVGDRPEDEGAAKAAGVDFMWAHEWANANPSL